MCPVRNGRRRPLVDRGSLAIPFLLSSLLCAVAPDSRARADPGWTLLSGPSDAPPRAYHALIFDSARNRLLIAGGTLPFPLWALPLDAPAAWSQLVCDGTPPELYAQASVVHDSARDRLLVFGGICRNGSPCDSTVWTLSLAGTPTWAPLAVAGSGPSARDGHTAIYDPVGDRMIVFGGRAGRSILGDAWALSLGGAPAWTPILHGTVVPAPRTEHVAVYDPAGQRMILFGGWNLASGGFGQEVFDDVWELSLGSAPAWTELQPAGSPPPPRVLASAIFDPVTQRMIVHAGLRSYGLGALGDAWALSLTGLPAWSPLMPDDANRQNYGSAAAFDPVGRRMLVSGGYVHSADLHSLALDGPAIWSDLPAAGPALAPARRHSQDGYFDARRSRLLIAGGFAGSWQSDVWSWSESDGWQSLAATGTPFAGFFSDAFAYDSMRDRLLFTAGGNAQYFGHRLDQVAALGLAGTPAWTPLVASDAPPGRIEHSAIYDPVRDRMVIFGGRRRIAPADDTGWGYDDTWALALTTMSWSAIAPAGNLPPPRGYHQAFYDAARDRMIVFGGRRYAGDYVIEPLRDAWALSFGAAPGWTALGPPAPEPGTALFDSDADRLLLCSLTGERVWALPLANPSAWVPLPAGALTPGWRSDASLVLDAAGRRALLFGGQMTYGASASRNDLWKFPLDDVTATALALVSAEAGASGVSLVWHVSTGAGFRARLERRADDAAAWSALATLASDDSGRLSYLDRDVVPGGRYDYRLAVGANGVETYAGEVTITVPNAADFALRAQPNPSAERLFAAVSLPSGSPARLELLDLAGRRVVARDVSGAGRHVVSLGEGGTLAPGLYLIRITHEGRSLTSRAAVIR